MKGIAFYTDMKQYSLMYVGTDNNGFTGATWFNLTVRMWNIGCSSCTGDDFNQWTSWIDNYYLEYGQWKIKWSDNKVKNTTSKQCDSWHQFWNGWSDTTRFNCTSCASGYFYFNNGWYDVCPDGYYNDYDTYTWQPCHEACTKWFGSSSTQCTEWNKTLLYKLTDSNQ